MIIVLWDVMSIYLLDWCQCFCHPEIQAVGSCETIVPTYQTAESVAYLAQIVGHYADWFVSWHALQCWPLSKFAWYCGPHYLDQSVVLNVKVLHAIYEENAGKF
jgi:hypothetical protein